MANRERIEGSIEIDAPPARVWEVVSDLRRMGEWSPQCKKMIIRGGENIYVAEVEQVLTDVPGVADAAVVGRPDETWGEVVVAFVEHREQPAPTVAALEELCRARLASYKVPVEYHVLVELPLNPTGKVRKNELVARL